MIVFLNEISALHLAIEKGNIQVVKLLLEQKNIDVNSKYIFYIFF